MSSVLQPATLGQFYGDGAWRTSQSHAATEVFQPATAEVIGGVPHLLPEEIFARDAGTIRKFVTDVDAGMVGVNVGVPVPMAIFPFSGRKQSFFGDLHAHGKDGVRFYTASKVVTSRVWA